MLVPRVEHSIETPGRCDVIDACVYAAGHPVHRDWGGVTSLIRLFVLQVTQPTETDES